MMCWDIKGVQGLQRASKQLLNFCFHTTMSTMPSQLKEVIANAPSFGNPELFWVDSDVEEEEDPEKIQQEVDEQVSAMRICN